MRVELGKVFMVRAITACSDNGSEGDDTGGAAGMAGTSAGTGGSAAGAGGSTSKGGSTSGGSTSGGSTSGNGGSGGGTDGGTAGTSGSGGGSGTPVRGAFSLNILAPDGCSLTPQYQDFPEVDSGHPVTDTDKAIQRCRW